MESKPLLTRTRPETYQAGSAQLDVESSQEISQPETFCRRHGVLHNHSFLKRGSYAIIGCSMSAGRERPLVVPTPPPLPFWAAFISSGFHLGGNLILQQALLGVSLMLKPAEKGPEPSHIVLHAHGGEIAAGAGHAGMPAPSRLGLKIEDELPHREDIDLSQLC